jgi:hypothetical protein
MAFGALLKKNRVLIPIDNLYNASNFSIKKALINLVITNKVLQTLDQPNNTKFALYNKWIKMLDIVERIRTFSLWSHIS